MIQIFIAIILIVLAIFILFVSITTGKSSVAVIAIIFTFISIFLIIDFYTKTPKVLDIYQGKTLLKITYEDEIPVDSVVILKIKIYEK